MKNLEDITADDFKGRENQDFTIAGQPVKLKEVKTMDAASPKFRAPVSLIFTADEEIGLDDGPQAFKHPDLGEHHLLVHRVVDPDQPTYEIVLA